MTTPKHNDTPSLGDERWEVMLREAQAFVCSRTETSFWSEVKNRPLASADVAEMIAQFALNILDLKTQSVTRQSTGKDERLIAAEEVIEHQRAVVQGKLNLHQSCYDDPRSTSGMRMYATADIRDTKDLLDEMDDKYREYRQKYPKVAKERGIDLEAKDE